MKQTIQILYFALLMSQVMMVGIGYAVILPGLAAESNPMMFYAFLSLALILLYLSHHFYGRAVKKYTDKEIQDYKLIHHPLITDPGHKVLMIRQTHYVLSWALSEVVTIFGVIMPFFGLGLPYMATFWTLGLANHLLKKPLS